VRDSAGEGQMSLGCGIRNNSAVKWSAAAYAGLAAGVLATLIEVVWNHCGRHLPYPDEMGGKACEAQRRP